MKRALRSIFLLFLGSIGITGAASAKTLYFPHYGDGDGLSMIIVINNLSNSRALGQLRVYDRDGRAQALPFSTGTTSQVSLSIPANGSTILTTLGTSSPLKSGFLSLELDQRMFSGVAIFKFADGREASVLPVEQTYKLALYVESSLTFDTGVAVARSATRNGINLHLYSASGIRLASTEFSDLQYQGARFLRELFSIGASFRGMLVLESNGPFSAVGLRFGRGLLSTLPLSEFDTQSTQVVNENLVVDPDSVFIAQESGDYVSISGKVVNRDLSDATFPQVAIAAFDREGQFIGGDTTYVDGTNRLLGSTFTNSCLEAGDVGYFDSFFEVVGEVDSVTFLPVAEIEPTSAPLANLEVISHSISPGSYGWTVVAGKVKNTGSAPLEAGTLNIIYLDNLGRVRGIDLNFPDQRALAINEETTFMEETTLDYSVVASVAFSNEWRDVGQMTAERDEETAILQRLLRRGSLGRRNPVQGVKSRVELSPSPFR